MNAAKQTMPNAVHAVFAYLFLLLLSFFVAALVWARWAPGHLYVCTDPLFDILDIIPPFVHPGTDDVYLAPVWEVWLLWSGLIVISLGVPAVIIAHFWRKDVDSGAD